MIVYAIITGICFGWASITTGLLLGTQKLLDRAQARADSWERIAGDVARGELRPEVYARVAMPEAPPEPKGTWQYDSTGLVRSFVPADPE